MNEIMKTTVTEAEYRSYFESQDLSKLTKSGEKEIEEIEDLLEIRRGLLKGQGFYVGEKICKCGRRLTFLDFVETALKESSHTKPFLVHALLGNKYGFQTPRSVSCSECGEIHPQSYYKTPNYSCREGGII